MVKSPLFILSLQDLHTVAMYVFESALDLEGAMEVHDREAPTPCGGEGEDGAVTTEAPPAPEPVGKSF